MKTKFGYMPCETCGERIVVKINDKETLSYSCDECEGAGYAKKGEGRYAIWLKKITPAAPAVTEQPPKKEPAAPPARKPTTLLG